MLRNDGLVQFSGAFDSFCHLHHGIEPPSAVHSMDDCCVLCAQTMGKYHPIKSIPLLCCNNGWIHKTCLREKAFSDGETFPCPSCQNDDDFYEHMLANGIYVKTRYILIIKSYFRFVLLSNKRTIAVCSCIEQCI